MCHLQSAFNWSNDFAQKVWFNLPCTCGLCSDLCLTKRKQWVDGPVRVMKTKGWGSMEDFGECCWMKEEWHVRGRSRCDSENRKKSFTRCLNHCQVERVAHAHFSCEALQAIGAVSIAYRAAWSWCQKMYSHGDSGKLAVAQYGEGEGGDSRNVNKDCIKTEASSFYHFFL